MYAVGMSVLCSRTGVCRVESIGVPSFQKESGQVCYKLRSVFSNSNELLYIPVEPAASLRPLIGRAEAAAYLDMLPQLPCRPFASPRTAELSGHYRKLLSSPDVKDHLLLIKEIHSKRRNLERGGKRLGQVDTRYLKVTERLVCEEFAAALDTTLEQAKERLYAALEQEA